MSGRARTRLGILVVLGMLASLVLSTSVASAAPDKNYLVEVTPFVAVDDSTQEFIVRFTNVDGNNPLGGIELKRATATLNGSELNFSLVSVGGVTVSDPSNSWSSSVLGDNVRLLAGDSASRLNTGEWVELRATYQIPDVDAAGVENDIDLVFTFPSEARQANNFNAGGNDFFPQTDTRDEPVSFRDGNGVTGPVFLESNQVLVVSGTANDCAVNCSGVDTQADITVQITVEECNVGTLVVDATDLLPGDTDLISGFYNYLPGEFDSCFDPEVLKRVFIDFTIPKTVVKAEKLNANSLTFAAYYGIDISEYDPDYPGDGELLNDCDDVRTFNCVIPAKNGKVGIEAGIVLIFLPTDPGGITFR